LRCIEGEVSQFAFVCGYFAFALLASSVTFMSMLLAQSLSSARCSNIVLRHRYQACSNLSIVPYSDFSSCMFSKPQAMMCHVIKSQPLLKPLTIRSLLNRSLT
jgi:hypothetical protein